MVNKQGGEQIIKAAAIAKQNFPVCGSSSWTGAGFVI
jgi:hypothetical protein